MQNFNDRPPELPEFKKAYIPFIVIFALIIAFFYIAPYTIVPAGHVGVIELFGKVNEEEMTPGFHLKNPLAQVYHYETRDQKLDIKELGVPSQDQLITKVDLTVLWKVDATMAAEAFKESGTIQQLQDKQLEPTIRTLLREAGKGVAKAEEFFNDGIQTNMQEKMLIGLQMLKEKGISALKVQMRNIELPSQVSEGVMNKKRQEQLAEQQKAEFDRFKTEQQQKVAQAEAEKDAAIQEAEQRIALADALAYEIEAEATARAMALKIEGEVLRENPEILKLRSIEKWNGDVPKVMMGNGAIPMINLSEL